MVVGYIRVSTKEQNIDLQKDALLNYGAEKLFTEKISAIKERTGLTTMLDFVRAGDVVVVWKLDRIARSLKHLLQIIQDLKNKNVHFVSLTEKIDTTSAMGNFFLQITGAFAELDRNLIIERTKAGLLSAKERGRVGGRKKGLSDKARQKAKAVAKMYQADTSISIDDLCVMFGIGSRSTLYRYLKHENINLRRLNT